MKIRLITFTIILLISVLLLVSSLNKLNFGMNIQGGVIFLFECNENNLEAIGQTLSKRVRAFNLLETRAYISDNIIKIASLRGENLDLLLIPGEFEAKILQEIKFENKTANIKIGPNFYPVELIEEKLKVNNSLYEVNQKFSLEDIEFDLVNITENSAIIEAKIFTNEDVVKVLGQYSYLTFNSETQTYEFYIPVEISSQASNKFLKVTKGLKTSFVGRQQVLEGFLTYYLDGKQISKLNIPFELSIRELKNIAIIGFGRNRTAVQEEKTKIQAVLESGSLPELKLIGTESYEPKQKKLAIEISLAGSLTIVVLTAAIIWLRYKTLKGIAYTLGFIASEIVCIFGAIALTQRFFVYGWTIDIKTILGLIVFSGLSLIFSLLILEQRIKKKELKLKFKYKEILSIKTFLALIFFAVSLALLFTSWKGFGLALLTGLILSILITKPLYDEILTKFL